MNTMDNHCELQSGFDTFCYYHSLSPKQKRKILDRLQKLPEFRTIKNDYFNESYRYGSDYFAADGVKIYVFRERGSVWGLLVVVHPTLVLGDHDRSALYQATKSSYKKIVKIVDKMLGKINVPCSLDNMKLYRLDVTANLIFDDDDVVDEYIRILKKSLILPHYKLDWFREKEKKAKDCNLANRHSHKQYCKSAAFFVYDKTAQLRMTDHFSEALLGKKVLRLEAQLRRKTLKKWVSGKKPGSNWEIIRDIYKNRAKIINWYLGRMQPAGRVIRYADAVKLISGTKIKSKTRDRMLYLLRKTSDKYSLTAALEALRKKFDLSKSQCKTILNKFKNLGISPITLRNDSDFEEILSLSQIIGR